MSDSVPAFDALSRFIEQGIPFNRHLGMKVDLLERKRCVMRVPWQDYLVGDLLRPAVHGGVLSALADTAGGAACFATLTNHGDKVSTVDLRIDYLRPSAMADLLCDARVVRMGNRVAVVRMDLFSGDCEGEPIATGHGVYNVLRKGESTPAISEQPSGSD